MRGKAMLTSKHLRLMDAMWSGGETVDSMARKLGISRWTIMSHIVRHRGRFPLRNHHGDWWRERLAEVEGMSSHEAARALGCSHVTVTQWRRRLNGDA